MKLIIAIALLLLSAPVWAGDNDIPGVIIRHGGPVRYYTTENKPFFKQRGFDIWQECPPCRECPESGVTKKPPVQTEKKKSFM